MNQIANTFSSEEIWRDLENQKQRFPQVNDLERRVVNSSNLSIEGQDASNIGGPNFIIFSTTSFPLRFPEFKHSLG